MIKPKVIAPDTSEGDLEEVAHWADLHQRPDRKVSIEVVIAAEGQSEDRVIDRSGGEPQAASESPSLFVCSGVSCPYGCARGQDR